MKEPIFITLANASLAHKTRCREEFQKLNLSEGQPKVLNQLLSREGIVQKELARRCGVKPATMTSLLHKMESDGLIEKKPVSVSGGKRAYGIYLTDYGRRYAIQVKQILNDYDGLALKDFSEEEKKQLALLLRRVISNLS